MDQAVFDQRRIIAQQSLRTWQLTNKRRRKSYNRSKKVRVLANEAYSYALQLPRQAPFRKPVFETVDDQNSRLKKIDLYNFFQTFQPEPNYAKPFPTKEEVEKEENFEEEAKRLGGILEADEEARRKRKEEEEEAQRKKAQRKKAQQEARRREAEEQAQRRKAEEQAQQRKAEEQAQPRKADYSYWIDQFDSILDDDLEQKNPTNGKKEKIDSKPNRIQQ